MCVYIIHIKYILQILIYNMYICICMHVCVCVCVNMTKSGFWIVLRGSVIELCSKRLHFSLPVCHLLTPKQPHKTVRGLGIFPFRKIGRPPACARHRALFGSVFLCSGLAVCFFFCLKVCFIQLSGMPPAFCLSDPTGEGSEHFACNRRSVREPSPYA